VVVNGDRRVEQSARLSKHGPLSGTRPPLSFSFTFFLRPWRDFLLSPLFFGTLTLPAAAMDPT
jgi:hypothetical protein